jgi:outer membrane protein assembly factor BamB
MRPTRRGYRVFVLLVAAGLLLSACDWAAFRYGPSRTGFNESESLTSVQNVSSLVQSYTGSTGGGVFSSPAVAHRVVYVGSFDGSLYAFHAGGRTNCSGSPKTCAPLWTADLTAGFPGTTVHSSPTVANGMVYIGSDIGTFFAFDAAGNANCSGSPKTCAPLWTANLGSDVASSPVVVDGVVYVASAGTRQLFALDAAGNTNCSGSPKRCMPLWTTTTTNGTIESSPAVTNGVIYIGDSNFVLYAFDAAGSTNCSGSPKTCAPLWTSAIGSANGGSLFASPAVSDGIVYFSANQLFAFDAAGSTNCSGSPKVCAPLWTAATASAGSLFTTSPGVANGIVYVGSNDSKLYAFDATGSVNCSGTPKTCAPLWTAATGGQLFSSPAIANGVTYVGSLDFKLYAFDAAGNTNCSGSPKTCAPLWTATTGGQVFSSPAVANGVVYVGSDDSKLYAYARG